MNPPSKLKGCEFITRGMECLRIHWPIVLLTCLAAFLIFTNLGKEYLWSDEGDTAVLARSVLQHGVPKAWDGVTFTDSDYGQRLNEDLVMVSHPWLQYYITAASFLFFGETTFGARFLFALCGLATIVVTYMLTLRHTGSRLAAITASILLVLSVQFLLFSRQSRNYSPNALLTLLLVGQFFRLTSWRHSLLFALGGILSFHTHPIALGPLAAMGLLTLIYRPFFHFRKWFWIAASVIACFTLPWISFATRGYSANATLARSPDAFLGRMAQFGIECASVTPVVGIALLGLILWRRQQRDNGPTGQPAKTPFSSDETSLLVVLAAIVIAYAGVMALTQSRMHMWMSGLRYIPAVIPFAVIVSGLLIVKVSRSNHWIWIVLVLVFGLTKMARITPWTFWEDPKFQIMRNEFAAFHVPPDIEDRFLRTGQIGYLRSLFHTPKGTVARICEFLTTNAVPGDILITNYEWEPLYFHTRLPQGYKILPDYPIYKTARKHHLPEYVFKSEGAKWVVWRRAWGTYRGQNCEQILEALRKSGRQVEQVASIPETVWENRENIHFRRYPGREYKYQWHEEIPDALIFRVEQPGRGSSEG